MPMLKVKRKTNSRLIPDYNEYMNIDNQFEYLAKHKNQNRNGDLLFYKTKFVYYLNLQHFLIKQSFESVNLFNT